MRALAVALAALLLAPAAAFGHATLQATVPARGAKLERPPAQVVFRFDEAVEASFGALRVFDTRGREVQAGKAFHPGGNGAEIGVRLRPGLGDGTYTATYRVVSADGHVVSSGFVFSVGEAGAPAESLDQLLAAGGRAGRITNTALSVARAVQYAAIALGLGALIFVLVCWRGRSRAFTARVERLILVAGIAGVLSALAALVLQGAIGEGTSFWSAARPSTVGEVLGTRFGTAWGLATLAWLLALAAPTARPLRTAESRAGGAPPDDERAAATDGREGEPPANATEPHRELAPAQAAEPHRELAPAQAAEPHRELAPTEATEPHRELSPAQGAEPHRELSPAEAAARVAATAVVEPALAPSRTAAAGARPALSPPRVTALAVPLFALALLPSFGGHASVQHPVAVLLPANILHVLAISAWAGGIAVLVFALRAATSELAADARAPLLASTVGRFSALATVALPLLIVTGVIQGVVEVGSFGALLDSAFGRAVLIKAVVAVAIVVLGYVNRQRLLPVLRRATTPGRAGVALRRTLRAELALGATALAVTGALASYAPSVAKSSGPYSTTINAGPARIEATVDPARIGPNQLHLYLFDRATGAPFEKTKELRVTAAMPEKQIAPLTLSPHVAGPGHYVVDGASFGVAGRWTVTVTVRVSDFDEYSQPFTVPIN